VGEHFGVDPAQLRRHAANLEAVREQFAAVKGASTAINQDHAAYGLLCGWIAGILEGRHRDQDDLYAYVEQNLTMAADSLAAVSAAYEDSDGNAADRISRASGLS
jgi:hypothetical protein